MDIGINIAVYMGGVVTGALLMALVYAGRDDR